MKHILKHILFIGIILGWSQNLFAQETNRTSPQFPGGQQALAKFIYSQMHYPAQAQMLGLTGLVKVQFTVLRTGKILNAHIIKDIGGGCGMEALHLISMMPTWKPGTMNGKITDVSVTLPIMFDLRNAKYKIKKRSRREMRRLRKEKRANK